MICVATQNAAERLLDRATLRGGCLCVPVDAHHDGYGQVGVGGRTRRAHIVAYEAFHGPVPAGLVVRHKCDNRACVNPGHLELGTHAENAADKMSRGRHRTSRRLTPDEVRAVRRHPAANRPTAAAFGLSEAAVRRIKSRKSHSHVPDLEESCSTASSGAESPSCTC